MRNFWRIVSPLRGWHPKTAGGSRLFSILRRRPLRCLLFVSSASGTEGKRYGGGREEWRRMTTMVFYDGASCGANRAPFSRQASSDVVIYRVRFLRFLFTKRSLTCPSYKLTREWLCARNPRIKNCFLLAHSLRNLLRDPLLYLFTITKNTINFFFTMIAKNTG